MAKLLFARMNKSFPPRGKTIMPVTSITRKIVEAQHFLFIRRRIAPSKLHATLGECFGKLFTQGAKAGLPIAGWPLCRYVHTGPYENLPDTNAAIERWIDANGYEVSGAAWEQYVTDPVELPNPAV